MSLFLHPKVESILNLQLELTDKCLLYKRIIHGVYFPIIWMAADKWLKWESLQKTWEVWLSGDYFGYIRICDMMSNKYLERNKVFFLFLPVFVLDICKPWSLIWSSSLGTRSREFFFFRHAAHLRWSGICCEILCCVAAAIREVEESHGANGPFISADRLLVNLDLGHMLRLCVVVCGRTAAV